MLRNETECKLRRHDWHRLAGECLHMSDVIKHTANWHFTNMQDGSYVRNVIDDVTDAWKSNFFQSFIGQRGTRQGGRADRVARRQSRRARRYVCDSDGVGRRPEKAEIMKDKRGERVWRR